MRANRANLPFEAAFALALPFRVATSPFGFGRSMSFSLRASSKAVYHLVFEATAIAFADPVFGLDVYWFPFWLLVLDWLWTLGIGFGLVWEGGGEGCNWIGLGEGWVGLVLVWFWIGFGLVLLLCSATPQFMDLIIYSFICSFICQFVQLFYSFRQFNKKSGPYDPAGVRGLGM